MAIDQFFNLKKKKIDNNIEIIIDKIVKAYNIGEKTYKIDEEDVIISNIEYTEIMQALHKLFLYKE